VVKTLEQLIKIIILGIIQGLTEWLPISSTGHLKLFENLLDMKVPILFDVILHAGTLIVILVFFRKEISKILSALAHLDFKTEHGKMVPLIIVGVIPTALIGLVFGWLIESAFQTILPVATAFLFCGIMLYSAKFGKEKTDSINYSTAIIIGIAQGIAIIPGISRSGATITVALLLGIKREKAFKFSFLLSIPAILGALGYTAYTEFSELTSAGLEGLEILAGAIAAMLVGYFALKLLWKTIAKGKFHLFAFYCWILGAVLVLLSVF
jgi:undecaprenyl-diphosphatase